MGIGERKYWIIKISEHSPLLQVSNQEFMLFYHKHSWKIIKILETLQLLKMDTKKIMFLLI